MLEAPESLRALVRNPNDVPEGDDDTQRHHPQKEPGRVTKPELENPTDDRTACRPGDQLGEHATALLVARFGRSRRAARPCDLGAAGCLEPLIERRSNSPSPDFRDLPGLFLGHEPSSAGGSGRGRTP